jgi:nucleotide-binding universal stress UspA family protein
MARLNLLLRSPLPVPESADLVVVGSRGLRGLKALGSVSERVAHQARSSVLVVRPGHG